MPATSLSRTVMRSALPCAGVLIALSVVLIVLGQPLFAIGSIAALVALWPVVGSVRNQDDRLAKATTRLEQLAGTTAANSANPAERLEGAVTACAERLTAERASHDRAVRRGTSDLFAALTEKTAALANEQLLAVHQIEQTCTDPTTMARYYDLDRLATRLLATAQTARSLTSGPSRSPRPEPVSTVVHGALAASRAVLSVGSVVVDEAHLSTEVVDDVALIISALVQKVASMGGSDLRINGWLRQDDYTLSVGDAGVMVDGDERVAVASVLASAHPLGAAPHPFAFAIAATLAARHGIVLTLLPETSGFGVAITIPQSHLVDVDEAVGRRAPGLLLRPFTMADGRTSPSTYVDPDVAVMRSTRSDGLAELDDLSVEARAVLELLDRALTPIEIGEMLGIPVGVAMVLVGDLIAGGHVIVQRTAATPAGASLLEQALNTNASR